MTRSISFALDSWTFLDFRNLIAKNAIMTSSGQLFDDCCRFLTALLQEETKLALSGKIDFEIRE